MHPNDMFQTPLVARPPSRHAEDCRSTVIGSRAQIFCRVHVVLGDSQELFWGKVLDLSKFNGHPQQITPILNFQVLIAGNDRRLA